MKKAPEYVTMKRRTNAAVMGLRRLIKAIDADPALAVLVPGVAVYRIGKLAQTLARVHSRSVSFVAARLLERNTIKTKGGCHE